MSVQQVTYFALLACTPCVVDAAEALIANRWDLKARLEGITPRQRQAYEQLAKLRDYEAEQVNESGTLDYDYPKGNPMAALRDMGIRAIPALAEALDDGSSSKTSTREHGIYHNWKVNELVALLIRHISDHSFVVEDGQPVSLSEIASHRALIPEFQAQILRWYRANKDKTVEDRKIAEIGNGGGNAVRAAVWLGQKKSVKAVPFLMKQVERVLEESESSLSEAELAEISLALGRIGDPKGLPAVKKACEHLSYWLPRSPGSSATQKLFTAYQGLALLGQKKEALAELNQIYKEFRPKMEPHRKKEFEERLGEAAKW